MLQNFLVGDKLGTIIQASREHALMSVYCQLSNWLLWLTCSSQSFNWSDSSSTAFSSESCAFVGAN